MDTEKLKISLYKYLYARDLKPMDIDFVDSYYIGIKFVAVFKVISSMQKQYLYTVSQRKNMIDIQFAKEAV
jgi:hypothetical protein